MQATPPIQLANTLDLLQGQLEQLLLADDVQVAADAGIFAREPLDLCVGEVATQAEVQLAREVVVEFGEELDVEEEDSGRGELVGNDVEEDLGAVVFVFLGRALLGPDCEEAHFDEVCAVAEEDAFAAWGFVG